MNLSEYNRLRYCGEVIAQLDALALRLAKAETALKDLHCILCEREDEDHLLGIIDKALRPADSAPAVHGCKKCGFREYSPGDVVICSSPDCPQKADSASTEETPVT